MSIFVDDTCSVWLNIFLYCAYNDNIDFVQVVQDITLSQLRNHTSINCALLNIDEEMKILVDKYNIPPELISNKTNEELFCDKMYDILYDCEFFGNICFSYNHSEYKIQSNPIETYFLDTEAEITLYKYFNPIAFEFRYTIHIEVPITLDKNYFKNHLKIINDDSFSIHFNVVMYGNNKISELIDDEIVYYYNNNNEDIFLCKYKYNVYTPMNALFYINTIKCTYDVLKTLTNNNVIKIIIYILHKITCRIYAEIIDAFMYEDDVYIIPYEQYIKLNKKGFPLCNIFDVEKFKGVDLSLSSDKKYKFFGYGNVSEMRDIRRRNTLIFLLHTKLIQLDEIKIFIKKRINCSKNQKSHYKAVKNWETDLEFLENEYNESINIFGGFEDISESSTF